MKEDYKFYYFIILLEILMIILYRIFTEFAIEYKTKSKNLENITHFYPMF
jgi:bacteriorhodopsin